MFSILNRISCPVQSYLTKSTIIPKRTSVFKKATNTTPIKRFVDKEKHKLIYEFKFINLTTAIMRSKRSVPIILVPLIPILYSVSGKLVIVVLSIGAVHLLSVHFASYVLNNLIGKIYVNKEGAINEVVVCSLNKFGRRVDRIHDPNDLIITNIPFKILGASAITVKNCNLVYLLFKKNSRIHDMNSFSLIFNEYSVKEETSKSS